MTNPRYQHDILIIDRSWSINEILAGMQDGLTEFLHGQDELLAAQGGELERVTASLWQFDDKIDCVGSFQPVPSFLDYKIQPRGNTALRDAIGRAVTTEGEQLAALPEDQRPGQVVVVIASDGLENVSQEWTWPQVRALLRQQQGDYGWQVVYMGTNQDAFAEAEKIGVAGNDSVLEYRASNAGTKNAWKMSGSAVGRWSRGAAGGQHVNVSYSAAERAAAQEDDE